MPTARSQLCRLTLHSPTACARGSLHLGGHLQHLSLYSGHTAGQVWIVFPLNLSSSNSHHPPSCASTELWPGTSHCCRASFAASHDLISAHSSASLLTQLPRAQLCSFLSSPPSCCHCATPGLNCSATVQCPCTDSPARHSQEIQSQIQVPAAPCPHSQLWMLCKISLTVQNMLGC